MSKFKVNQCRSYKVIDEQGNFLHSDGSVLSRGEYWPTEKQAQAVLYKFQPPLPLHVWVHGDILRHETTIMIYLTPDTGPELRSISCECMGCCKPENYLPEATFLFNIKDILSDRGLA